MLFEGKSLSVSEIEGGIYQVLFDLADSSVNKFDKATITELEEAVTKIKRHDAIKGLVLCSAKKSFFVGADITEFGAMFQRPEPEVVEAIQDINALFSSIEDLPFPTVVAINGEALGGGFEICLACDYRVMASNGKVALPEVKLGIMPGCKGCVERWCGRRCSCARKTYRCFCAACKRLHRWKV